MCRRAVLLQTRVLTAVRRGRLSLQQAGPVLQLERDRMEVVVQPALADRQFQWDWWTLSHKAQRTDSTKTEQLIFFR